MENKTPIIDNSDDSGSDGEYDIVPFDDSEEKVDQKDIADTENDSNSDEELDLANVVKSSKDDNNIDDRKFDDFFEHKPERRHNTQYIKVIDFKIDKDEDFVKVDNASKTVLIPEKIHGKQLTLPKLSFIEFDFLSFKKAEGDENLHEILK